MPLVKNYFDVKSKNLSFHFSWILSDKEK